MRYLLSFVFGILLVACKQSPQEQLALIEGYWEIASVEFPSGEVKEYSISQNIDFIDILSDSTAVRKKVQPDIAGNFTTSLSTENIDITVNGNTLTFNYTTSYDQWTETIEKVTKKKLVMRNADGKIYTYRRYEPIVLE